MLPLSLPNPNLVAERPPCVSNRPRVQESSVSRQELNPGASLKLFEAKGPPRAPRLTFEDRCTTRMSNPNPRPADVLHPRNRRSRSMIQEPSLPNVRLLARVEPRYEETHESYLYRYYTRQTRVRLWWERYRNLQASPSERSGSIARQLVLPSAGRRATRSPQPRLGRSGQRRLQLLLDLHSGIMHDPSPEVCVPVCAAAGALGSGQTIRESRLYRLRRRPRMRYPGSRG